MPDSAPLPPMPMVVGSPRSGTTLLRLMLDAHPQLTIPPETGFLGYLPEFIPVSDYVTREIFFDYVTHFPRNAPNWADFRIPPETFLEALHQIEPFNFADGFRMFYRLYAARVGKPRWGDKTPTYFRYMNEIRQTLPEARFIHIIRDGRDVALSLRPLWFSPGKEMETLAQRWRDDIEIARRLGQGAPDYFELHYERLIAEPESVLRQICAFIDLEYDPAMLRYHEQSPTRLEELVTRYRTDGTIVATREDRLNAHRLTTKPPEASRVFNWKREMTPEEQARYLAIAGDLLAELGYEV